MPLVAKPVAVDRVRIRDFWNRVDTSGGYNACWPWTGCTTNGYGSFKVDGKTERAHRIAFSLAKGDIDPGHCIGHTCNNKLCFNDRHLEALPPECNTRDAHRDGLVSIGKHLARKRRGERELYD
jgi:hypothetical protein